jgi:hypothetical protein
MTVRPQLAPFAVSLVFMAMPYASPSARAQDTATLAPFGIPLGQTFTPNMVSRIAERKLAEGGNIVRYKIVPKERNPLLDEYALTTTSVGELTHVVSARKGNCAGHCEQDYRQLVEGLQAKYGSGAEVQETDTEVEIRSQTLGWTIFVGDRRITLKVTPPGPLELTYVDFSPPVKQALQSASERVPEPSDPAIMKGL